MLQQLMQNAGFQVRLAENGAQGVEAFQSWRPQFVWMDLRMPVMDGKEAVRRIRALDGGREVRIVAVSASAFATERNDVLALGADDFIAKPYRPGEIFDCMARHLGLKRIDRKPPEEERHVQPGQIDLSALPQELTRDLRAAVVMLDSKRIREVITRISDCDATVGHKLSYLADCFAYTPILEAAEGFHYGLRAGVPGPPDRL
jgi:CheY-like chemotaxis protein